MVKRNRVVQAEQASPINEDSKSLIKNLASCKQTTRDRALRTVLRTWLPEQTEISDEGMKQLWQGIFYCIWHADKSLYQSELIDRLSSALQSLPLPLSIHYFTVFLFTMRREWSRIDRLRLDKFYLLIRRFLHGFFSLLDSKSWDLEFTCRMMSVLFDGTFFADDTFQGNGVNYHIASAFVEELRPFLPVSKEVLELVFSPFVKILGVVNDKILVGKIKSNLFDELLKMGKKLLLVKKSGIEVPEDDDVVVLGSIALSMEFAKRFYEMGSSPDCDQGNRKSIFAIHQEFLQLEKDMLSSGIEVSIGKASCDGKGKVSELVPVSGFTETDGSNAVSKSKKVVENGSSSKKVVENGSSSKKKKKGLKKCSETKKGSVKKDSVMEDALDLGNNDENFDESMISDLRQEFEKIAAEMPPPKNEVASVCEVAEPVSIPKKTKKRKRENKGEAQDTVANKDAAETSLAGPSGEKSSKRVRFAMKNNLVWKPHCPLPPQDLRLPPSATPRGSALKKGIPPGPVREFATQSRRTKKKAKPAARRVKTIKNLKKKLSP